MTDYTNISARAMLATLSISVWNAQRFDRAVSEEVNEQKNAEKHSGRFNKHLFGTRRAGRTIAPEFFAALDAGDRMRDIHDAQTLAWGKRDGERLLPTANYFIYTDLVRKAGAEFESKVATFIESYPRLIVEAKTRLGKLYRADDFIDVADIKKRFSWSLDFDPVPSSGDIRVDLPADQLSTISAEVESRSAKATREAMRSAWERLGEAVSRIHKASQPDGIVRGSLIENARTVVDVLVRLNVAGDERLEEMRARVERDLAQLDLDDIRNDDKLRADTAKKAKRILDAMSDYGFALPSSKDVAAA